MRRLRWHDDLGLQTLPTAEPVHIGDPRLLAAPAG